MSSQTLKLPILQLSQSVVFPGATATVLLKTTPEIELARKCLDQRESLALTFGEPGGESSHSPAQVALSAMPLNLRELSGGIASLTLVGVEVLRLLESHEEGGIELGAFAPLERDNALEQNHFQQLLQLLESTLSTGDTYSTEEAAILFGQRDDAVGFVDAAAQLLHLPRSSKLELLAEPTLERRIESLLRQLRQPADTPRTEAAAMPTGRGLATKGDDRTLSSEDNLSVSFRQRAQMMGDLPLPVREKVFLETERLRLISTASSEYTSIKGYLDWLLSIPWAHVDAPAHELVEMQKIIEQSFYGPQMVKDRIVEYLAMRQVAEGVPSPPLCFSGPAGTGKAALAHAIAEALGRKWIRFSVAGLIDGIDIRGEPRSLVGAMPGKLVTSLIEAGTSNPVVLIEDLDKLCQDETRLSAALALLAAIDPKQNGKFVDDYIALPLDLSRVIFIFSVRGAEEIPEALQERMEIVDFPGYIDKEKLLISQKYLMPDLRKRYGITDSELTFTDGAIKRLISNYTMEAGLGQLKGRLETICRRFAKTRAAGGREIRWAINADNVEDYVGTPVYLPEKAPSHPEIGVAAGVAWTGAGGDIMMIEGLKMRGGGQVTCTGSLGEIMRESVQAAHSFVRSKADLLSIPHEDFANYDIHIHFPQGAIPKDGPSAGVTISLVIASVMSDRPIRNDIAMTGEVSLRGRVLPVAGVKEKVAAAHRAGIFKFVLPKQNQKDLKDLPADLLQEMEFILIDRTDQLFDIALLDYEPGAETLEDLLLLEMKERAASEKSKEKGGRAAKGRSSSKPKSKRPVRKSSR